MTDLQQLINALIGLVNSVIPLLLGLAVVVFIWGVIRFLAKSDNPDERKNMKNFLVMGIIAITVILSIWGLSTLLKNSLFPSAPCPVGISGCGAAPAQNNSVSNYANNINISGTNVTPNCPQGQSWDAILGNCELPIINTCPQGQSPDPSTGHCVSNNTQSNSNGCGANQFWNTTTNSCQTLPSINSNSTVTSCPSGETLVSGSCVSNFNGN